MQTELRKMTEDDFDKYIEEFIPDYAKDLTDNFLLPADLALEESKQLMDSLLPDKQESDSQSVYNIYSIEEEKNIGVIWYNIQPDSKKVFIYHILVYEDFRKKGYATRVLQQLESDMKARGITSLGLSVFGNNSGAYNLYKKLGYNTASISMGKTL
ncbi:GNAT family N-acetyltransferase [Terribacillus saccharophilus]|nr:GNAT family N-acetyltransferase [Terribacillus saccharophilus]